MSNIRDNEPSLDYFELRRRHEEYKNNQARAKAAAEQQPLAEDAVEPENGSAPREQAPVTPAQDAAPAQAADVVEAPDALNPDETVSGVEDTITDELPEDDGQQEDDLEQEPAGDNPNPFEPFLNAFSNLRGKLASRFGRRGGNDEDYADGEDAGDEDYADADGENADGENYADAGEDLQDAEEAPARWQKPEQPAAEEAVAVEDVAVEDVAPEDVPAPASAPRSADELEDGDFDEVLDEDDADEDDADEDDEDADRPEQPSGFKRFLRLFVVPADEVEGADDADEE